jgi:hypothetical protein
MTNLLPLWLLFALVFCVLATIRIPEPPRFAWIPAACVCVLAYVLLAATFR